MLHLSAAASDGLVPSPSRLWPQQAQSIHTKNTLLLLFLRLFDTDTPSLVIYMGWGGEIIGAVGPVENKQR